MDADFRKLVQEAAPRPSARPDVEAMWERARRQRVARRLVAAAFALVLAAVTWSVAEGDYLGRLLGNERVDPAGQGDGESSPTEAPTDETSGTLYLENLCRDIGDCGLTVIDLDAGTSRVVRVPELALGDSQFRIVRTGTKLVFRGSTSESTGSDIGAFTLDLDLEGPPRQIGESWYVVPSATDGRVWLAILDPESPSTVRALKAVKEVTAEGEVTVPSSPLPAGRWSTLVGAVQGALVFQGSDGLEVWDLGTQEVVMRLPGPFTVDTHGDLIAWCAQACKEMHITDVTTGESSAVPPGEGFSFVETTYGAFSPDGSLLAVPAVTGADGKHRLALVDVEQGTATMVEGSELDEFYGSIAWSSSGDWVFFNAGNDKVMAYHPGSEEARFVPAEIEGPFFGIASS
jgi:WD40 repeat protein